MWTNFDLDVSGAKIIGYHWPLDGAKRVVVIIHGIGEHAGRYDRMAKYFADAGIALVGMDLRGHGRTDGVRGHAAPRADVLADIDALITYAKETYPDIPLVLYGHSMGGNLVLDYRRRGRLSGTPDGYVISAPWVKLANNFSAPMVGLVHFLAKIWPTFKASSSCDESVLGNPKTVRPYKDDPLVHPAITMLCASECYDIGLALFEGRLNGNNEGVKKPTLLMHGSADQICDVKGSRQIAKMEPDITYVEWLGYFHEIHNGNTEVNGEDAILRAIDFINSL